MIARKQSTTTYPIQFLMVDSSDHVTAKTGLTPTVTISKNGGAYGAAAGAVSEIANGIYSLAGNATDRETLGELMIHASAAGADPVDLKVLVVSYDPLVDIASILTDTGTTLDGKIDTVDGLVDAIKAKTDQLAFTVAGQVDANALSGGTTPADVADAVWDEAISGHVAAGSFGAKNQKVVPSELVNDYKADVSGIPAAVWGYATRTLSSFGTLVADIWSYVTRTITAFGFTVATNSDANVSAIKTKTDQLAFTVPGQVDANSLSGGVDGAGVRAAIGLAAANLDTQLSTIDGVADAVKSKTDNLPLAPAAIGSAMTLTPAERTAIANEVESQIIDDTDAERVLTAITDKIASVNPSLDDLTLAGIASAVRTELTTELARIDAAISSRLAASGYTAPANADVAAIKAKTDNLPSNPADQSILAGLIAALPAAPSEADIITALKASVFDGLLTFEDSIKLYNAILFGKLDGGGSGTLKFRDPADTKDRVTATVDISTGDRDDITLDLT